MIFSTLVAICFGLIIGSFLSVCIYRIPLGRFDQIDNSDITGESEPNIPEVQTYNGEAVSFTFPQRSISPCCKKQLYWWHNIPLISWLLLGGKCAFCKKSIPFRYPLVEFLTSGCAYLSITNYGVTPTAAVVFIFAAAMIVITFIDYDYYIIPNLITYPGIIISIALAAINQYYAVFSSPIVDSLTLSGFGILAGGGFLYFVSEVYLRLRKIDGLGMGDVKLLTFIGALFGPECSLFTIFVGSVVGALGGFALIIIQGRKAAQPIPFGPSLVIGALLYIYFGAQIARLLDLPLAIAG